MARRSKDDSAVSTLDPPPVATYGEIVRKRIRADLVAYGDLVRRSVAGEALSEDQLLAAYETLGRLGFPPGQFEQDLAAVREHTRTKAKWAEYLAKQPAERERARVVDQEIGELKKRLQELQAEAHRLSFGASLKAAANLQRANELATLHLHVLSEDVGQAVELRARALRVDAKEAVA